MVVGRLQNLTEFLLLLSGQTGGEVDLVSDDEVTTLALLFGDGHSQPGVPIFTAGLRGTRLVEVDLLSVDCRDGSLPAGESFFEIQSHSVNEIIVLALKQRVRFLRKKS